MGKAKILGASLVLFAIFSASAEAKLYKWVDEKGETHYGEVVPPEYANRDQVQIEQGRVVKKAEPKVDAAQPGKNASDEQAATDQRRKDKALINTYSNEKEIDLARDRNLQQVEARVASIKLLLKSAQESLDGYRNEVAAKQKANKAIPDSLQSDINEAENKVAKLKQDLAKAEEKQASVKAGYEADKKRFRELTTEANKSH